MYKYILIVGAVVIVIAALVLIFVPGPEKADNERNNNTSNIPEGHESLGGGFLGEYPNAAVVIVRTNDGYEPNEVTVKKGETISFLNQSDEFHWPASDVHPTHSIYSEFDPHTPVAPGDTWSFQFDEAGVWEFHDHIRANKKGTIIVVE